MRIRILLALLESLLWLQAAHGADRRIGARARATDSAPANGLKLPLKAESVRFAVIGDSGTGKKKQYEVGQVMERFREKASFDFAIMLGDNIYGRKSPADLKRKFDYPYRSLLDAGVKFYASLGNHDDPNERFYKPFNMDGNRYYHFTKGNAEFFALDSNYMDQEQLEWLRKGLEASKASWKICYFHHPLYSDGKFHGSSPELRALLEPVLEKGGANVVLSGHEHVYERIKPQKGIYYFVLGNSGELRARNLRTRPADGDKGFDTDQAFMVVEIAGDQFHFQTVSRMDQTVDSGVLERQTRP